MNDKFLKAAYCLLICGSSLWSSSCSSSKAGTVSGANASEPESPLVVAVARVRREDLSHQLTVSAELRPYREVELYAKVAGYLKEIRVDAGDSVRRGSVIATLEIPEFNNDLNQATASRKRAENEVARARGEVRRAEAALD
ncbi:MAG TPA: biotin/lipoyl-binding protein, partial [Blastocatellia bacterium]